MPTYFNQEELAALQALEGKHLAQVFYTIWRNISKPEEPYEALDCLELRFADGDDIAFTRAEEGQGIQIEDYHFALEQTKVVQQFRGQVELERIDMSQSPVWQACIGLPVTAIGLEHHGPKLHPSHVIQIEFGRQTQEIALGEEGLIVVNNSGN
ncbi:MAG: hypothetical protein AAF587_12450 [Bacteroidota bacterium]